MEVEGGAWLLASRGGGGTRNRRDGDDDGRCRSPAKLFLPLPPPSLVSDRQTELNKMYSIRLLIVSRIATHVSWLSLPSTDHRLHLKATDRRIGKNYSIRLSVANSNKKFTVRHIIIYLLATRTTATATAKYPINHGPVSAGPP